LIRASLVGDFCCDNFTAMQRLIHRRNLLRLAAGLPLFGLAGPAFAARADLIERLIAEAKPLPRVSHRMDYISGKLLGIRYQANTLIGSPDYPERFVVRDDAFDCVTFCEVVLAAAIAHDMGEFETALRRIRYDHGKVQYDQRNHYWTDWCERNIASGICRPVAIEPSVTIDKTLTWHSEFGRRRVSITAISKATMMDNIKLLAPGDIVGITSGRAGLDYYHTGLVAFGRNGELLLRNASQRRGRVVEERMVEFATVNPVRYVTLLRAAEPAPPVAERR
jgi:N-acetylmuramoyl-L-alanine amidase-like protein